MADRNWKPGDMLRIRAWDDMVKEFGLKSTGSVAVQWSFTPRMRKFCGDIVRVRDVRDAHVFLDGETYASWSWSHGMFERVTSKYPSNRVRGA